MVHNGRERERKRENFIRNYGERALLGTMVHNGGAGLGRRPRTDSASPRAIILPHPQWWSSILHGEDFPRTLMRGSPDGAVEPVCHRQETLDLAA
jgi:hypothetical protein